MHEYFASKTFSNFNSELMCMFENRFDRENREK